jgi:Amt family ammonium transporter
MAPHNLVLTVIGGSLLWVGWFGFNAGSAVAANGAAGMAMAVTQIATAAAALSWMFVEWMVHRRPSVLGIVSGAVAGLVAITPASGFVDPKGALTVKRMLGYDDSLDVFGIHGVGGIVGAVLTGVFAVEAIGGTKGLLEGNAAQVWVQIYGILATVVWSAVATFVILMLIKVTMGLRVEKNVEIEGLDINLHGEVVQ